MADETRVPFGITERIARIYSRHSGGHQLNIEVLREALTGAGILEETNPVSGLRTKAVEVLEWTVAMAAGHGSIEWPELRDAMLATGVLVQTESEGHNGVVFSPDFVAAMETPRCIVRDRTSPRRLSREEFQAVVQEIREGMTANANADEVAIDALDAIGIEVTPAGTNHA